jgi:hypothetical protein
VTIPMSPIGIRAKAPILSTVWLLVEIAETPQQKPSNFNGKFLVGFLLI